MLTLVQRRRLRLVRPLPARRKRSRREMKAIGAVFLVCLSLLTLYLSFR